MKTHLQDITRAQEQRASVHKRVTHTIAIIAFIL